MGITKQLANVHEKNLNSKKKVSCRKRQQKMCIFAASKDRGVAQLA